MKLLDGLGAAIEAFEDRTGRKPLGIVLGPEEWIALGEEIETPLEAADVVHIMDVRICLYAGSDETPEVLN